MIKRAIILAIAFWEILCLIDIVTTKNHWESNHQIEFSNGSTASISDHVSLWVALQPSFAVAIIPLVLVCAAFWVFSGKRG